MPGANHYLLLSNASATGAAKTVVEPGLYCFEAVGTFSGATVSLERLGPDATTYYSVGSVSELTAADGALVEIPAGIYRAAVASGPPSGIYANLTPVRLY